MSMAFYAVGLLPLIRELKGVEGLNSVLQMWYADDASAGGCINKLIEWYRLFITRGPDFGYFPEPSKSIVVVRPEDIESAKRMLEEAFPTNCPKVLTDQRLLGGHLGSIAGKRRYVSENVDKWFGLIGKLAAIATTHPQAAYTALTRSVRCEWQYMQRTVEGCGPWFAPLEQALTECFLPALLQAENISPEMQR